MDEFKKQLTDRFDAAELVDLLCVDTEDVVEAFWDKIIDCKEDLEDFLKYGR